MTCKDCIHFKVCDSGRHIGEHIEDDGVYSEGVERECVAFERKQSGWISVEERLPDGNGRFLTVDKKGDMMVCYWEKRFGWFASVCNKNAITHWMPLPEAPKMRKEDEGK